MAKDAIEIKKIYNDKDVVTVKINGKTKEVSGNVANALVQAKRAVFVKMIKEYKAPILKKK